MSEEMVRPENRASCATPDLLFTPIYNEVLTKVEHKVFRLDIDGEYSIIQGIYQR